MSIFNNLIIFSFILITPCLTLIHSATFNITNNCSYTVWAAANPFGGMRLNPGQNWVIYTDHTFYDYSGRIWARTNCDFTAERPETHNKCETGDCDGVYCRESFGAPPVTLAEFTLNQTQNIDFLAISVVSGFNVPMEFSPTTSTSGCITGVKCTADINNLCPTELRDPGGCHNPCTVFNNDQFCCTGGNSTHTTCGPTAYSKIFKDACPNVYTYPFDDPTSIFTCPTGTDYKVVFCP